MNKLIGLIAGVGIFGMSISVAKAIVIEDTQSITSSGQSFSFNFSGLQENDGAGGTFFINLNGDYTAPYEGALVGIDFGVDTLTLNQTGVEDGIGGLTLTSFQYTLLYTGKDALLEAQFDVSASYLDSLMADNAIQVDVQNSPWVDAFAKYDADYVNVGFTYNAVSPPTSVPEPSVLALITIGLAGAGFARWRRQSASTDCRVS